MASECKVRLQSSDGKIFEVDKAVAFESETIKRMIQDIGEHSVLPLPEVRGNILAKVIEYCKFHVEAAKISDGKAAISPDDVEKWDQEFAEMDPLTLYELVPFDDGGQGFPKNIIDSLALKHMDLEYRKKIVRVLYAGFQAPFYLEIKKLEEFVTDTAAKMIRGKTPEEIRRMFNIKNDFTPEEEARLRSEFAWAYQ